MDNRTLAISVVSGHWQQFGDICDVWDIGSRSFGLCGLLGGASTQTLDHTGIWGVWMPDKLGDFFFFFQALLVSFF